MKDSTSEQAPGILGSLKGFTRFFVPYPCWLQRGIRWQKFNPDNWAGMEMS